MGITNQRVVRGPPAKRNHRRKARERKKPKNQRISRISQIKTARNHRPRGQTDFAQGREQCPLDLQGDGPCFTRKTRTQELHKLHRSPAGNDVGWNVSGFENKKARRGRVRHNQKPRADKGRGGWGQRKSLQGCCCLGGRRLARQRQRIDRVQAPRIYLHLQRQSLLCGTNSRR